MYNTTYLQHHGVLGMKWGVRRYQNADGTLTAAGRRKYERRDGIVKDFAGDVSDVYGTAGNVARGIGKSTHTKIGTKLGADVGALADVNANMARQIANERGVRRTLGNLYGSGATKAMAEAAQKSADIKSKNAYTKLGGRWAEQRSHNYGHLAKSASNIHSSVTTPQWVARSFKETFTMPYERLSGRTTTMGREYANYLFTGGLYGLAADVAYLSKKKKK